MPNGTVHTGLSFAEYQALPGVNLSSLKRMAVSALAYQHGLANPTATTDAMLVGKATHTLTLEPQQFDTEFVVSGLDRRTKAWKLFRDDHAHQTILRADDHAKCQSIAAAVRAHKGAARLLVGGKAEVSLTWTDPDTGIDCKCRLDYAAPGWLLDLKTTADPTPVEFGRSSFKYGYHLQAASYSEAWELCTGERLPFWFIAAENRAPWDVVVYSVPEEVQHLGSTEYHALLEKVAFCRDSDSWPGISAEPLPLTLPAWAFAPA